MVTKAQFQRAALYLTYGSASSILVSIAASQILLGLAIGALLLSRTPLRFPPIGLPLYLFIVATIIAVLLSPDVQRGLPQLRKFYVFAIVLVVYTTFQTVGQIRVLYLIWGALAALSGIRSLLQFVHTYRLAEEMRDFSYDFFLDRRNTGFAGHWMTFGGELMIVFLTLLALLLLSQSSSAKRLGWICLSILLAALVLGLTRSIFLLGVPLGAAYLIYASRSWMKAIVPVVFLLGFLAATPHLRERIASVTQPDKEFDSNLRRNILRRAGIAMITAHPWFGLGPEQIGPQFERYVPSDVSRPLPKGWYGHLHNVYLQYAAERGIPALLLMLWLIVGALYDFWQATSWTTLPADGRFILQGAIAVIIGVLAEGFFEYNLGDSEVLTLFLVVMSCAYVVRRQALESPQKEEVRLT